MPSLPRTSGIYCITCNPTSKIYIGSSVNIYRRWNEHLRDLRRKDHCNQHLQHAWDKYGESAFVITVLEECGKEYLTRCEQHYLDTLSPFKERGFNINPSAESCRGRPSPMKGRKLSPRHIEILAASVRGSKHNLGRKASSETRAKMSASAKARGFTPDHRANISKAKMGHSFTSEGLKNLSESHMKKYIVTDPNGIEMEIVGLVKFCRERGLQRVQMGRVADGKQLQHRGWKCRRVES